MPPVWPEEVLVKQDACNICTTDYQQWLGLREGRGYPIAGGHESAGTVIETGDMVTDFYPGDKVALTYITCGLCEACKRGLGCTQNEIGPKKISEDGYRGMFAFADYAVRPARALVKMRQDIPPSEAAFTEPLATVVKGLEKLRLKAMETVLVIGGGTLGLLNASAARVMGCGVIVCELMDNKLLTAQAMGFETIDGKTGDSSEKLMNLTEGKGADAVIVAAAFSQVNNEAIKMVKQIDGRILFFAAGYPPPELGIDSNVIHYRRLEMIGTFGAELPHFYIAADMLNQGRVQVSHLIEKNKYPLDKIQEAFAEAAIPGKFRVSVLL
jgi:L-iditol 2-dehydrogenase